MSSPFPNLVGLPAASDTITMELEDANIPPTTLMLCEGDHEVDTDRGGELAGWRFIRRWNYWSARSPQPLHAALAQQLDPGTPAIRPRGDEGLCYHLRTEEGLRAFADLLRGTP